MNRLKTYVAQTDAEAAGLRKGTITELVIPLEPQPAKSTIRMDRAISGYHWIEVLPLSGDFGHGHVETTMTGVSHACPYQAGELIIVYDSVPITMEAQEPITRFMVCLSADCRPVEGRWMWCVKMNRWENKNARSE